jgi:hypothetical protein
MGESGTAVVCLFMQSVKKAEQIITERQGDL